MMAKVISAWHLVQRKSQLLKSHFIIQTYIKFINVKIYGNNLFSFKIRTKQTLRITRVK